MLINADNTPDSRSMPWRFGALFMKKKPATKTEETKIMNSFLLEIQVV
jgi:hypothetical protein